MGPPSHDRTGKKADDVRSLPRHLQNKSTIPAAATTVPARLRSSVLILEDHPVHLELFYDEEM